MTTRDYERFWVTTSDYKWVRVTTRDYQWLRARLRVTTSDYKPLQATKSDYEWLRARLWVTTSDHEWLSDYQSSYEWLQPGLAINLGIKTFIVSYDFTTMNEINTLKRVLKIVVLRFWWKLLKNTCDAESSRPQILSKDFDQIYSWNIYWTNVFRNSCSNRKLSVTASGITKIFKL